MQKIDDLINWGEVSRILSGTRSVVTRGRIPNKHKEKVNGLKKVISEWVESL